MPSAPIGARPYPNFALHWRQLLLEISDASRAAFLVFHQSRSLQVADDNKTQCSLDGKMAILGKRVSSVEEQQQAQFDCICRESGSVCAVNKTKHSYNYLTLPSVRWQIETGYTISDKTRQILFSLRLLHLRLLFVALVILLARSVPACLPSTVA